MATRAISDAVTPAKSRSSADIAGRLPLRLIYHSVLRGAEPYLYERQFNIRRITRQAPTDPSNWAIHGCEAAGTCIGRVCRRRMPASRSTIHDHSLRPRRLLRAPLMQTASRAGLFDPSGNNGGTVSDRDEKDRTPRGLDTWRDAKPRRSGRPSFSRTLIS